MDAKNDDSSGGSDSLDKSLQRKCVVDDMGQGERMQQQLTNEVLKVTTSSNSSDTNEVNRTTLQHNKTDITVGDGGGNDIEKAEKLASNCTCDETSAAGNLNHNINNNNNNNAFETKVTQISKDLKETTLAEYAVETANSRLSSSCSSSSTSSTTSESGTSNTGQNSEQQDNSSSQLSVSGSVDEQDQRSKKVRFHPDVKENDGGKRVLPKKKKKLKQLAVDEASLIAAGVRLSNADEDMDYEEEDDVPEEDEEFDLVKTVNEAQNYLKMHPLTFASAVGENNNFVQEENAGTRLHNGKMEEDDLPTQNEAEDDELLEQITPENGVECILGKQIKAGKAEYILRYVNRSGLFWENEEFIRAQCPNLLHKYESNRERHQERLMQHVAKKQNLRQRYTDF